MKKLLLFITAFVICTTTIWAKEIPEGYVSLYTLDYTYNKGEANESTQSLANYLNPSPPMAGSLPIQLLGPGADWNLAKNYCDVSDYEEVRIDLTFDPEDAGHQFAIRYARFGELSYKIITVPESLTYEFDLELIPNSEGENHLSALLVAGEHFSYTLTAPAVSKPVEVNYVALKLKTEGIPVTGISLEEDFTLKLGKTKTLNYTILPANASNKVVTWTSSNEEVATIDKLGKITPLTEGTTTITVTTADGGFSDECVVTVVPLMPEGYVSLYTLDYTYNKGEENESTQSLANYLTPSLPPIAGSLPIQLLGPGADWNLAKNYCDVSDYEEVRIDLSFDPEDVGHQFAVRYARFGELSYEIITVPESLTYEFALELTPNSEGENHLSALLVAGEHFSYTLTAPAVSKPVEVNYVALKLKTEGISVTGISLEEDFTLKLGKTKTLNYTILPANASNKVVTWTSSNEEVATIDKIGKITPLTEGTTTITVTTADGGFSDECVVTVIPLMPEGYVSLYTLDYTYNKGEADEFTQSLANYLTPSLPPMAANLPIQLLGPGADWNLAKNYCDVSDYEEVRIDLTFDPEDLGHQFAIRYARFGELSYEIITVPESLTYEFALALTPNSEGENHLSALLVAGEHFSYTLTAPAVSKPVEVDCVILKVKKETGIESSTLTEDPNKLVDVYNVAGLLIRRNVKLSEATIGLSKGIYIVGNKKIVVSK